MTRTTREIEQKKNQNTMWISVIASLSFMLFIGLITFIVIQESLPDNFEQRLAQLPQRVCHNETITTGNHSGFEKVKLEVGDKIQITINPPANFQTKEVCEIK
jgi:hypothetical protein